MSEFLYYGVKREVAKDGQHHLGAVLMRLMEIDGAEDFFVPIDPERLHTTLLYAREFSRTVRNAVQDAPIAKTPPETWEQALKNGILKMPHTAAPTHAQVMGITSIKDRTTNDYGSKSLALLLRSKQLTAERSHVVGMANVLSQVNHRFGTGINFLHHVTLGSIAKDYNPEFIAAAEALIPHQKLALEPVTTFSQIATITDRHLA